MFEYKCLPLPTLEKSKDTEQLANAQTALTDLLNSEGANGWAFDRQETFSFEQKSGLMGRGKPKKLEITTLIFRRSLSEPAQDTVAYSPATSAIAQRRTMAQPRHQPYPPQPSPHQPSPRQPSPQQPYPQQPAAGHPQDPAFHPRAAEVSHEPVQESVPDSVPEPLGSPMRIDRTPFSAPSSSAARSRSRLGGTDR